MGTKEKQESGATVKRVGMVIKLRPEYVEQYLSLHADSSPGVRDLLTKYHLKNFSIFLHKIGGEYFEFGFMNALISVLFYFLISFLIRWWSTNAKRTPFPH